MSTRVNRRMSLVLAAFLGLWACDSGDVQGPQPQPPPNPQTPITASDWVKFVNWDLSTVVEVQMVETSESEMSFSPNQLTFEAGKPYVLRLINPAGNGKHYFSPEGLGSFYQAIATRKIETSQAEYKAAFFDAVELKTDGALEIFFVPVLAGTYEIICTIPGHESYGMTATVTITGGEGYQLDLEVSEDFDQALRSDSRRSSSHAVWAAPDEVAVDMWEAGAAFEFRPPDLQLTRGVGYRLRLDNPSGNASKHYYTAADFYKTVVLRKAEDGEAEIKAPYLNAVELLIGGEATLFLVPTEAGTFEVICTIPGHAEAGMTGTIEVTG